MMKILGTMAVLTLWVSLAMGQDTDFSNCIVRLQERARTDQLPDWIVNEVVPELEFVPRVIELDRFQPEFTQTFAMYLHRRLTPARIERGRVLRDEYEGFLAKLTEKYGIPGHYLIAFWGLETNFGQYLGKMPTLDCLATLACDSRRSGFFTEELRTALTLLDRESLSPADMQGSWAGAMGHTQFMPSAYIKYAIDDGPFKSYRGAIKLSPGEHTIKYFAVDRAGNEEKKHIFSVIVEETSYDIAR